MRKRLKEQSYALGSNRQLADLIMWIVVKGEVAPESCICVAAKVDHGIDSRAQAVLFEQAAIIETKIGRVGEAGSPRQNRSRWLNGKIGGMVMSRSNGHDLGFSIKA
ncbi:hypothetical protein [Pseudomonas sichuanensis]|uniref:hypothetical protein n=1 Tax=Pseudomonas TaxID=286 RepID=UPI0036EB1A91